MANVNSFNAHIGGNLIKNCYISDVLLFDLLIYYMEFRTTTIKLLQQKQLFYDCK